MSDETAMQKAEADPVEEAVSNYDPVEYLNEQQIHAVMKMVLHPKATNAEIAKSVDVTPRTISNWKANEDFMAYLNAKKAELVNGAIEASSRRRALIYDKLTDEMMPRFEEPERDPVKLEGILGPNYTNQDRQRYEERFVTNMTAEKLLKVWGQFDEKIKEDADQAAVEMGEEALVERIRDRHTELKALQKDMVEFVNQTGFIFNINIHDQDPETVFSGRKEVVDAEVIDAEYEESKSEQQSADDEDLLAQFSLE